MPYNEAYTPVKWRDFWRFGCGALGDFGCHDMDASTWAFDLKAPTSIELHPAGYSDENIIPYGEIGYYEFDKRGKQAQLKTDLVFGWGAARASGAASCRDQLAAPRHALRGRPGHHRQRTAASAYRSSSPNRYAPPSRRPNLPLLAPTATSATGWMLSRAARRPVPTSSTEPA